MGKRGKNRGVQKGHYQTKEEKKKQTAGQSKNEGEDDKHL